MKAIICGGAVLVLLAGDVLAQSAAPGTKPKAAAQSKSAPATPTATSKITFHSRPPGAKVTLDNGRSCIAPCSMIVGFNEKFTAIATKPGYQKKEILVSPSLTNTGKAQVIGSALGAGVIGLVVGAAIADRAYGPEPFVVELVPDAGGGSSTSKAAAVSPAAPKPAAAPQAAPKTATAPQAAPKPAAAAQPAPARPKSATAPQAAPAAAASPSEPAEPAYPSSSGPDLAVPDNAPTLQPGTSASRSTSAPSAGASASRSASAPPAAPAAPRPAAPKPVAASAPAPAQYACNLQGCVQIKAGCRVRHVADAGSGNSIGGQSSPVVCR